MELKKLGNSSTSGPQIAHEYLKTFPKTPSLPKRTARIPPLVLYNKSYDTSSAGRILIRHHTLPRNHKNTNHRMYKNTITNN